ncbi:hypothetical protein ACD578_28470 (plasmid) [Microvirga sp. RSM25]|uniref:hypothetical protein n=1 Tax=Microvirga sp. RSM25 TaxID=3273802 RepID=UPI00384EF0EA
MTFTSRDGLTVYVHRLMMPIRAELLDGVLEVRIEILAAHSRLLGHLRTYAEAKETVRKVVERTVAPLI